MSKANGNERSDENKLDKLTQYAKCQYPQAQEMASDPGDRALILATTVGRQAKRLGLSKQEVERWLQGAYGSVWVRMGNLNPGADLKEIRKALLKVMR